ncbi:MAG: hypothetical protein SGBAC_005816 [Bacillariaceae sp.]
MVMSFFASPKGKKKAAVIMGDNDSLQSVNLEDGIRGRSPSSHSRDSGSGEMYKYQYPDQSGEQSLSTSFRETGGNNIDAKLLKQERQLQKVIAKSKDKPLDKKVQKATDKRREKILKEKVKAVTAMEQDSINRCLGVDEEGYCLRHQDQKVRMGIVQPLFRFETISICQSCAFGAASGLEVKNHGQKDNTIAHAVNGALVATGVKKKKKKVKGSFAANVNGSSPNMGRVNLNDSFNVNPDAINREQFASNGALEGPSMPENFAIPNHTSPHSRSDLEQDAHWMEEVQVRVLQVNSWHNSAVPLKCHPNYAKYFRMLDKGIPVGEIKEMIGEHGPDLLVLSLDPEKALNDQMPGLPLHIQERLRSNHTLITSNSANDDESETVDLIYKSYLTQLHVFEHFLQEEEAGINAMRDMQESSSDVSASSPFGSGTKKKKKLRLTKKIKRFVGVTGTHKELSTDDDASEEENIELSEPSNSNHIEESPRAQLAVGPVTLQPLPTSGLRRARRPTANRRPRKPSAPKTPDRGVVQTGKSAETPLSPLSQSPGRVQRKSFDSDKMNHIMSTSSADELIGTAESTDDLITAPPSEQLEPPVVVKSFSSAPSDEDMGGLPRQVSSSQDEEKKASPAAPMVIKSFPSAANKPQADVIKKDPAEAAAPVTVIKSFPSRATKTTKNEIKEEAKETAAPLVIKSFPSAKRVSNLSSNKRDGKGIDPLSQQLIGNGNEDENQEDDEGEKRKKEELRKAVESMHQFKLGTYDDSFGSIPTTVLPDLHPKTGEPSIHSHLSSISSHSSDASSSFESESDSDSDSDSDNGNEEADEEEEEETEKETIDMDEYIHLSDKLIDANAELFEAKYLLENSQKREEALLEANKAKDRKILKLSQTIEQMQAHVNLLSAQNAEAGKIMMELTASIEENKREQFIRRLSIASSVGISMASLSSSIVGDDTPASQHNHSSGGPIRRQSSDTMGSDLRRSYGTKRPSGSGHKRVSQNKRPSGSGHKRVSSSNGISSYLGSATKEVEETEDDLGESSTPLMIAFASVAETVSHVPQTDSNVREVPPSSISNIREVPPKTSEPVPSEDPMILDDDMFPPAANVREITPHNRRRVKEVSEEESRKQVPANPIVPASAPAPSQPVVLRSYQPSERLAERRRKKRELEEKLKLTVAKSHSSDADDSPFVSRE